MSRIIIALDRMSMAKALELAEQAQGLVWGFKVNDLLLNYGAEIVYKLKAYGNVMADPKLHDIPNTMTNGVRVLRAAGADIITVHSSALYEPPEEFCQFLAGVTVLTSMDDESCEAVYGESLNYVVSNLSNRLAEKKYGYAVCSGRELSLLPSALQKICPGIRPAWHQDANDDQKRIMAPKEALELGADLLVMGRPLIMADDFVKAIELTKEEIKEVD